MSSSDLLQTVTKAAKTFRQMWRRGLSNVQCPWDREGGGGDSVGVRWLDGADTADYNVPTLLIWVSFSLSNIKISKSPKVHLWFSQNWKSPKKNKHWNDNILTLITMEVSTGVIILPTGADLYFSAHIHNYPPGDGVQTYNRPPCEPIWEKGANEVLVCSFD